MSITFDRYCPVTTGNPRCAFSLFKKTILVVFKKKEESFDIPRNDLVRQKLICSTMGEQTRKLILKFLIGSVNNNGVIITVLLRLFLTTWLEVEALERREQ